MADNEEQKTWLGSLNDFTSLIAAGLGIFLTIRTIQLGNKIDRLSESAETSNLVGGLIDNVAERNVKQDIALLAIEHTLTSESDDQRLNARNQLFLAKIAEQLLSEIVLTSPERTVETSEITEEEPRSTTDESRSALDESIAREILEKLKDKHEDALEGSPEHEIFITASEALNEYSALRAALSSESPTSGNALIIGDANDASGALGDKIVEPSIVEETASPIQALESQLTAQAVTTVAETEIVDRESDETPQELGIVYIHYDNPASEATIQELSTQLRAIQFNIGGVQGSWFVTESNQLVSPEEPNCATTTNIRFFHEEDEDLAEGLREQLITNLRANLPNSLTLTDDNKIRLYDLTSWSRASNVPVRQLELWIVEKGAECQAQRASQS